jgi:hypothetical protein
MGIKIAHDFFQSDILNLKEWKANQSREFFGTENFRFFFSNKFFFSEKILHEINHFASGCVPFCVSKDK